LPEAHRNAHVLTREAVGLFADQHGFDSRGQEFEARASQHAERSRIAEPDQIEIMTDGLSVGI
jgi:hypothetical protein